MKTKTVKKFITVVACVMAISAGSTTGRATLLVYEGYNGYTDGNIGGQTVNANTIGLDTSTVYSSSGTAILSQSTGLSFGDLAVSGGSATLKSGSGTGAGAKLLSSAT